MGEREVLPVTVYTDDLNAAIVKVRTARDGSRKAKKEAVDLMKLLKKGEIKDFMKNLPRIGRAERLLLTRVPGAREALMYTYRGKMLAGADPMIAIAVISLYVFQQIRQMQKQIDQERVNYENLIAEGLDATHSEIQVLSDIQKGFATWGDQWQAYVDSEGFIRAVALMVRAMAPGVAPGIPEPAPWVFDMGTATYADMWRYYNEQEEKLIQGESIRFK